MGLADGVRQVLPALCVLRRVACITICLRYAVAAAVLKQMSFQSALAHKDVCLEVAATAGVNERQPLLAVFYDEECRQAFIP